MKREIRAFRQHTFETCGACCMLMALDYFRKIPFPNAKREAVLYDIYRCKSFKGILASAIADCLTKNGLRVELYHSSETYLDNQDQYYPEELYRSMLDEYTETLGRLAGRITVETGCALTPDRYRVMLDQGKLLIVQCIVPGDADGMHDETLHWILLYGYENGEFKACDPLSGKIRLTEGEMIHYTNTPVGSICAAVSGNAA